MLGVYCSVPYYLRQGHSVNKETVVLARLLGLLSLTVSACSRLGLLKCVTMASPHFTWGQGTIVQTRFPQSCFQAPITLSCLHTPTVLVLFHFLISGYMCVHKST